MRILFISGREPAYVRNAMMLKGLRKIAVEIFECTDSSASYLIRYFKVVCKYVIKHKNSIRFVFVGFFGQPLVPIIKMLTSKPIIFDAFLSAYDTLCFDRKQFKPDSLAGRFFFWLDKHCCEISDKVLLDTNAHIDYFVRTFGLQTNMFQRIFVGADESLFYPQEVKKEERRLRVFYYSSFRPLHGTEYIIQAAKMLQSERDIEFKIVGNGPELKRVRRLAKDLGTSNIDFVDWIPYEDLPGEIAKSDICLGGHFSGVEKARRVIAGKTYQFIAMQKAVIVGDCPANHELFTHKANAFLVEMADPRSLADAILELRDNTALRRQIAEEGYKTFREKCDTAAIARELKNLTEGLTQR